jgi:hypothetical protein
MALQVLLWLCWAYVHIRTVVRGLKIAVHEIVPQPMINEIASSSPPLRVDLIDLPWLGKRMQTADI